MAQNIEKLEERIKELQAKKKQALKKEKEKQMKAELEELREFKKSLEKVLGIESRIEQIELKLHRWNEINSIADKYGKKMSDVPGILESFLVSQQNTQ